MSELPPGRIEIHKGSQQYILWLTPAMHSLLRIYARQNNISITDAGNRIILGFLTEHYGYESPAELHRRKHTRPFSPTIEQFMMPLCQQRMGKSLADGRYLYGGKVICHSLQPSLTLLIKITLNFVVLYPLINIQNCCLPQFEAHRVCRDVTCSGYATRYLNVIVQRTGALQ